MKTIFRSEEESKRLTKEKERLVHEQSIDSARIFIKFFGNMDYANDLMSGKFFCNTPAYYRSCEQAGVGDFQESVAYSREYNPSTEIASMSLKEIVELSDLEIPEKEIKKLEVSLFPEQFKHGWLHCWLIIDEVTTPEYIAEIASDLIRVREEFGTNFVFFTSNNFSEVNKRLANTLGHPVRNARVAYTDNSFFHNIACKRLGYKYQREFRFIIDECDLSEINPKIYELGDMSDIFQLNSPIKVMINGNELGFELSESGIYKNPKYFKPKSKKK